MRLIILTLIYFSLLVGGVRGQPVSLLGGVGAKFVSARPTSDPNAPGLFIGQRVVVTARLKMPSPTGLQGADVEVIRTMIEEAESRRDGYDAVQFGAVVKPPKRPTEMTLAEIFTWIDSTPGQPHAIGLYQFVPDTLRRVVQDTGIEENERFGTAVQDRLADVLIIEAGLQDFRAGTLGRTEFMNNLAKIWAGLPNSTGKSHYHGYAGNKASVTWTRFEEVMARITPETG
ncbi:hypothetical protein OS190_02605 [Sulfitobacter sp. F26204]|uniref:hypothetical protein n=1 Tax=Sulfitobacter sp. F26204 TaxID=2996014 RepID=UPI00225E1BD1|nr:hypothetical protein [Sulfitobacter sp. F26204]MCX7558441.1 hypothetical protein [Sulfitobacter sp. F26204]